MALRFRLGPEDADKYPEGKAWFTVDLGVVRQMRARELIKLESAMDGTTFSQIEAEWRSWGVLGLLGVMFIARRLAGVNEKWDNFDPLVWQVEWERVADDADDESVPPTGATEASPST